MSPGPYNVINGKCRYRLFVFQFLGPMYVFHMHGRGSIVQSMSMMLMSIEQRQYVTEKHQSIPRFYEHAYDYTHFDLIFVEFQRGPVCHSHNSGTI